MSNICLCIKIEKNVENVEYSLNAISEHISAYVICHNGRVPKTVGAVRTYFDEKGIPGTVNYCNTNNQKAIFRSAIYWDYMMMWNLEDCIVGTPQFDDLDKDRYYLVCKDEKKELCIYRSETVNNINATMGTIEGDYYLNKKGSPQYKILDGYTFFPMLDSIGGDLKCYNQKTVDELKNLADNDTVCAAFNTLGWMKYRVKPELKSLYGANKMTDGIYVKNTDNVINKKIERIQSNKSESGLTFMITACKRWKLFKETVDAFLMKCNDVEIFQEWVCIDDNSSPADREHMQKRYPFFRFIMKDVEDKGHQRSLNMLLDQINTQYVLNFEDDWFCRRNFTIEPLLNYVKDGGYGQMILRKILWGKGIEKEIVNGEQIYEYVYNSRHYMKPQLNRDYDNEIKLEREQTVYDEKEHWWWPGFSLNPGITNWSMFKEKVGYFNEKIKTELFEYDYALRGYDKNIPICYTALNIDHTGEMSSYTLNDTKRYYD
jgi:hypothetical protein